MFRLFPLRLEASVVKKVGVVAVGCGVDRGGTVGAFAFGATNLRTAGTAIRGIGVASTSSEGVTAGAADGFGLADDDEDVRL